MKKLQKILSHLGKLSKSLLVLFVIAGLGYIVLLSPEGAMAQLQNRLETWGVSHKTIDKNQDLLEDLNFTKPTETPVEEKPVNVQSQQIQPVQNQNNRLVDCVGPDGKHFQTTQQECDNFNNAWKKPTQNQTGSSKSLSKEEIQYQIQLEQAKQQNKQYQSQQNLDQYSQCTATAFSTYNSCTSKCSAARDYGNEACFASYSGAHPLIENNEQLLNDCLTESDNQNKSCWDSCGEQKSASLNACK